MDPLSVAGLAIGVVSLTFELFSACVKGYELLLEAKDMPKACRYLMVRLQMEKDKFLGWAVLAKISEDGKSLGPGLRINQHTVNDALREVQILLLNVTQLDGRYNFKLVVAEEDEAENKDDTGSEDKPLRKEYAAMQKKALGFIEKTRKYPKQLRWASFDKSKFEGLLTDVGALNDNMMYFLESYERKRHFEMQEATFMQILQVNNRMDDLFGLVQSLTVRPESAEVDNRQRRAYDHRVIRLTRFKAISLAIEQHGISQSSGHSITKIDEAAVSSSSKLEFRGLTLVSGTNSGHQPARSSGSYKETHVWVEWRYYVGLYNEDDDDDEESDPELAPPPFLEQRISKLAKMLRDRMKPEEFRVPNCLGYVHDTGRSRCGFVFQDLELLSRGLPMSLFDRLSTLKKPSLTTRIEIGRQVASSIWYLHATNWLHKGLRSDNIVFQQQSDHLSGSPFVCGFDYSRPANAGEQTELPAENLLHDLYRHPKTQFDVPRDGRRGFKKTYDIYSLGVVLFEIGMWKTLNEILGIEPLQRIKSAVAKGVQAYLLGSERLECLEGEVGRTYMEAVKTCLDGNFGVDSAEDATGAGADARLQLEFGERVIKKLESISV